MKKIVVSLIIVISIVLIGWLLKDITMPTSLAVNESRFITIAEGPHFRVVYDTQTKVEYVISRGSYNQGTFTLLVDKDGKPLLYEGE